MPKLQAPPVRRVVKAGVTKDEFEKLPPALKRVAKVNKAADKYKWSKK